MKHFIKVFFIVLAFGESICYYIQVSRQDSAEKKFVDALSSNLRSMEDSIRGFSRQLEFDYRKILRTNVKPRVKVPLRVPKEQKNVQKRPIIFRRLHVAVPKLKKSSNSFIKARRGEDITLPTTQASTSTTKAPQSTTQASQSTTPASQSTSADSKKPVYMEDLVKAIDDFEKKHITTGKSTSHISPVTPADRNENKITLPWLKKNMLDIMGKMHELSKEKDCEHNRKATEDFKNSGSPKKKLPLLIATNNEKISKPKTVDDVINLIKKGTVYGTSRQGPFGAWPISELTPASIEVL